MPVRAIPMQASFLPDPHISLRYCTVAHNPVSTAPSSQRARLRLRVSDPKPHKHIPATPALLPRSRQIRSSPVEMPLLPPHTFLFARKPVRYRIAPVDSSGPYRGFFDIVR